MAATGDISVWLMNVCAVLLLFTITSGDALAVKFGYTGPIGPDKWGSLNPTFSACSNGKSQSPINIDSHNVVINKKLKPLIMQYNHSEVATLVDNGFNVGIKYGEKAGSLILDGKTYNLKQMHWHSPSEHRIDGRQYAAELHLVHFAEDNSIAVLATLFHLGHPDPLMTKLQNKLNELAKDVASQKDTQLQLGTIDTHEIRKHSHKYYSYTGSLTTPPCSENVSWHILGKCLVPILKLSLIGIHAWCIREISRGKYSLLEIFSFPEIKPKTSRAWMDHIHSTTTLVVSKIVSVSHLR